MFFYLLLWYITFCTIVKEILKRTLVRMLICCVIALLFCITGNAKVPYIPKIINYSVSDYKAGNQNWAVSQRMNKISRFKAGSLCHHL